MKIYSLPKFIFTIIIALCLFCFGGLLFAQDEAADPSSTEVTGALPDQARKYREEGLENQRLGNIPAAMSLYQKAIALDPTYAVAYNDLGVIYEAAGFPDRARESYFKAIKVDPGYLSAYTNIALLYEDQRDLERAAFYWAKRAELGPLDDPWTQKAASRFKDIRMVLSNRPVADAREEDVLGLIKDVSVYKSVFKKADKVQAQNHLRKADHYYKKGKLTLAIKEALEAQDLDQANPAIKEFIEKIDLDPASAAAYNDLGVIYEAAGFPDRAEDVYLKAIRFDPTLLSAYVNIALFYEKQRDLEKAEFYWAKRAELGSPENPWKQKAANRVKDIRTVLSSSPVADAREEEVLGLIKDVSKYKSAVNRNDKMLAQDHFNKAKQSFNRGDLATAIKEALDAQYLDQDNPEIEAFIEKTELRALSR
ncbi:MAG: tetratricopeptide repeat protein [Candidatus Omnitrophica bacterium]|nr:tetratricopeptide repeat protein [Candidatus Omnitrophota bacterium]MDD5690170.1 tetratricopeptide repeat protein [Candidatus Omnitrophota bacterium]